MMQTLIKMFKDATYAMPKVYLCLNLDKLQSKHASGSMAALLHPQVWDSDSDSDLDLDSDDHETILVTVMLLTKAFCITLPNCHGPMK